MQDKFNTFDKDQKQMLEQTAQQKADDSRFPDNRAGRRAQAAIERQHREPIVPSAVVSKAMKGETQTKEVDPRIKPRFVPDDGWLCGDAFKLYKYQNEETLAVEWLWNSRDGVTPFMIYPKGGGKAMVHADWHEDCYCPNFVPPVGMRIFTNKVGFDPSKDQFNLDVVTVTQEMHDKFSADAAFAPWRLKPKSSIMMLGKNRFA